MELETFIDNFAAQFESDEVANINRDVDFKLLDTWDSLTAFSVQMMVEDEYKVKISPADFKTVSTVYDLFELVRSRQ